jgi:SAM-dependent methyltransferase
MENLALKCIRCRHTLTAGDTALRCPSCRAEFPIAHGVPRFVPAERYSESFGYQWNRFARTQLDSATGTTHSRDTFAEKTGWSLTSLAKKRVLEAGCGMGRFLEVCANAGADVHGVDLSTAVEAAHRNLRHRPNVHIYQADIMALPFAESTFDFVYSIGVLHHTPDTKAAFMRLVPLVKPGGRISIWVYSTRLRAYIGSEILRPLTSRLPRPLLLRLCRVGVPLYYVHRLPVIGRLTRGCLPTSMDPDPEWRWLDTFDWYSPRFQWKHSYGEVEGWFGEAGLTDISRGHVPTSVTAVKPNAPASASRGS